MSILSILTIFVLSFSAIAGPSYDAHLIVKQNPEIAQRFDFLKNIQLKNKVTIAVIGDYIHTDIFADRIDLNTAEIDGNHIDDDMNGYIDDYSGLNLNTMDGRLSNPVRSGHENAVVSLLDAFIQDNHLDDKIKLIPLNVTSPGNVFDDQYMRKVADAIDYARKRGAKVINMSIGVSGIFDSFFQFIDNDVKKSRDYYDLAVKRAHEAGIILVASNSNNPDRDLVKEPVLPANSENVIAVANVNFEGKIQSAYGENVELAYYGTNIYIWGGEVEGYRFVKGASFSTPLVALTAAVAKSLMPSLTYQDVASFKKSCEKPISGKKNIASRCIFSPEQFINQML
jgi:subtilisin family serine protease